MAKLDVSVIIPCFNRERFIGEAIDSALNQGDGVQVIVVDDGSNDGSWDVMTACGDRIKALRAKRGGPSAARNRGLAVATRKFVHFLDSDDRLASGALSAMAEASEGLPPERIAVGDCINIDEAGRPMTGPTRGYAEIVGAGEIPRSTILAAPMSTPLALFPLAALRKVGGFNEALRHSEDRELAVRLMTAGYAFVRVPSVVCEVREHSDNRLSASLDKAKFEHMAAALTSMSRHLLLDPVFIRSEDERAAFGRTCWSGARSAARSGVQSVAKEMFALAEAIAGRSAQSGSGLIRGLYRFLPPYRAERLVQAVKTLGGLKPNSISS